MRVSTPLLIAVVAAALTACSGGSDGHVASPPRTAQSIPGGDTQAPTDSSSAPNGTGTGDSSNATPTGTPILTPDPSSPALKTFDRQTVLGALDTARKIAFASVEDSTLMNPTRKHTLRDFSSITQYMSPAAYKDFATAFENGDAARTGVIALYADPGTSFLPDVPLVLGRTNYAPDLTVKVFDPNKPGTSPALAVSGSVQVYILGTRDGKHGFQSLTRQFTYYLTPTGSKDMPVQLTGVTSRLTAAKALVASGQK